MEKLDFWLKLVGKFFFIFSNCEGHEKVSRGGGGGAFLFG